MTGPTDDSFAGAMARAPWGAPPVGRMLPQGLRDALSAVYAEADARLRADQPGCRGCGACCRFDRTRPVLFASVAELALLVETTERPAARIEAGPVDGPWACPYQRGDVCIAREGRTLGCRTYFCEPEARRRGEAVYEALAGDVRQACRTWRYPWWYGPARLYLADVFSVDRPGLSA